MAQEQSERSDTVEPSGAMRRKKVDGAATTRRVFGLLVFMALVVFVLWQVRGRLEERGVDARLRALAPTVGADLALQDFDPDKHDRSLEAPPWQQGAPPVRLSDYSDKTLFVNFWASYCEPCKRELPSMTRLAQELAGRNFVMVAVSYDQSWADVGKFFEKIGGTPTNIVFARDPAFDTDPLGRHYGTEKIPESYVIKDGRILFRFVNERDWMKPEMRQFFDKLASDG